MPVLRSREITFTPTNSASKNRKEIKVDPLATPAQTHESKANQSTPPSPGAAAEDSGAVSVYAPNSRRSLRLSSKSVSSDDLVRVSKESKGGKSIRVSEESVGGKKKRSDDDSDEKPEERLEDCENDKRISREEKGKGKEVLIEKGSAFKRLKRSQSENEGRRFSREEKGKEKLEEDLVLSEEIVKDSESESETSSDEDDPLLSERVAERVAEKIARLARLNSLKDKPVKRSRNERDSSTDDAGKRSRMEQFRAAAKRNASRFAHFEAEVEVDNNVADEAERNLPAEEEPNQEVEDWPGPFSTAMKIIRERGEKLKLQERISSSNQLKSASVLWTPKGRGKEKFTRCPPSLQELCTRVLVKNADAITSLELVPDALRHKLSQILCDSRKMNCHFLKLLTSGSPTEIRLRDCSWLSEEQFTDCFQSFDTNNLVVLQLGLCGCCVADYTLLATFARSSNRLPALVNLSLTGAYRLTDVGLSALVSSAPALMSINLSKCSFVTAAGIDTIASSLGSILRELYMDQCESIDFKLMLPAMNKIKHLDVLSVAENESVHDEFIIKFVTAQGQNVKELILTGCRKLTDASLKSVGKYCPALCTLGIGCLPKLTDSTLGYLANGCRGIETLKLCRNAFSDDALAAFLETSGEPIKELSLDGLKEVGLNTAISLSKHSRNLITLDLSFCRDLSDEALGLILDSCLSLKTVKIFGCMQITNVSLNGHSNPGVTIIGAKLSPLFVNLKVPNPEEGPLRYSAVPLRT